MKVSKKIFYALMFLCMLFCTVVLLCAFIPGLSSKIAIVLYGENGGAAERDSGDISAYPAYTISDTTTAGLNLEHMPFQENKGYIVPVREEITVPEDAQGKSGYQGIWDRTSEVEEQEAEEILGDLGEGELGDDLQFFDLYYPYYAMLDTEMQKLYCQLYANAQKLNASFQPVVTVTERELYTVFEALAGDHPELFWMETGYQCKKVRNGNIIEITLIFNELANRLDSAKREFESAAEEILQNARGLESEAEQEKYIHDALAKKASYKLSASMNQSAYSALVNGETVCAGYARAFQYLMMQLGIPCYYCTGYSGENHAWNIVYVDGLFRNVDVTWDDGETVIYDYYNCSDRAFSKTHMRSGLSVYLPACPEEGTLMEQVSALDGIRGLINPNPIEPITLENRGELFPEKNGSETGTADHDVLELTKAGISASEVLSSLEAYYKDCEEKAVKAGTGQIQFENCIPAGLWDAIESAYSSGAYRNGYADAVLQKLGMDQFAITIQAVRLSGGYYRLYHMIATW